MITLKKKKCWDPLQPWMITLLHCWSGWLHCWSTWGWGGWGAKKLIVNQSSVLGTTSLNIVHNNYYAFKGVSQVYAYYWFSLVVQKHLLALIGKASWEIGYLKEPDLTFFTCHIRQSMTNTSPTYLVYAKWFFELVHELLCHWHSGLFWWGLLKSQMVGGDLLYAPFSCHYYQVQIYLFFNLISF